MGQTIVTRIPCKIKLAIRVKICETQIYKIWKVLLWRRCLGYQLAKPDIKVLPSWGAIATAGFALDIKMKQCYFIQFLVTINETVLMTPESKMASYVLQAVRYYKYDWMNFELYVLLN